VRRAIPSVLGHQCGPHLVVDARLGPRIRPHKRMSTQAKLPRFGGALFWRPRRKGVSVLRSGAAGLKQIDGQGMSSGFGRN